MIHNISTKRILAFQKKIFDFYAAKGRRALPFRTSKNPYAIAVAEIMLQQTQVDRVVKKYTQWIKLFPDWKSLASATPTMVLKAWSGLGYNRRALYLKRMAQLIVTEHKGKIPRSPEQLIALPGVGQYTSKSILIFAFNQPLATIDTNIRRVLIHELKLSPHTTMKELEQIAYQVLPKKRARDWHNALMDYATLCLPKTPSIKPLSTQSAFKGSTREIRGEIIRSLVSKKQVSLRSIAKRMKRTYQDVLRAARALEKEKTISISRGQATIR